MEDIQQDLSKLKELLEANKQLNIPITDQQKLISSIRELEFEVSKHELPKLKEILKNLIQLREETKIPHIPLKDNKHTPEIELAQKAIQEKSSQIFLQINAFCLKQDIQITRELTG